MGLKIPSRLKLRARPFLADLSELGDFSAPLPFDTLSCGAESSPEKPSLDDDSEYSLLVADSEAGEPSGDESHMMLAMESRIRGNMNAVPELQKGS